MEIHAGLINEHENMEIRTVSHLSLLEPGYLKIPTQTTPPGIDPEQEDNKYEVKRFMDLQDLPKVLIKWKGYEHSENTRES